FYGSTGELNWFDPETCLTELVLAGCPVGSIGEMRQGHWDGGGLAGAADDEVAMGAILVPFRRRLKCRGFESVGREFRNAKDLCFHGFLKFSAVFFARLWVHHAKTGCWKFQLDRGMRRVVQIDGCTSGNLLRFDQVAVGERSEQPGSADMDLEASASRYDTGGFGSRGRVCSSEDGNDNEK